MSILRSSVTGEASSSKAFMWFYTGFAVAICSIIIIGIFLDQTKLLATGLTWEPFAGVMTWLRDLVFISVLSFLGNEAANAYAQKKSGSEVNVETVEKVSVE